MESSDKMNCLMDIIFSCYNTSEVKYSRLSNDEKENNKKDGINCFKNIYYKIIYSNEDHDEFSKCLKFILLIRSIITCGLFPYTGDEYYIKCCHFPCDNNKMEELEPNFCYYHTWNWNLYNTGLFNYYLCCNYCCDDDTKISRSYNKEYCEEYKIPKDLKTYKQSIKKCDFFTQLIFYIYSCPQTRKMIGNYFCGYKLLLCPCTCIPECINSCYLCCICNFIFCCSFLVVSILVCITFPFLLILACIVLLVFCFKIHIKMNNDPDD